MLSLPGKLGDGFFLRDYMFRRDEDIMRRAVVLHDEAFGAPSGRLSQQVFSGNRAGNVQESRDDLNSRELSCPSSFWHGC